MPCYVVTKADGSKEEHRGMMVWIWSRDGYGATFGNPLDDHERETYIAPIGWSFHPDPECGVVLRSVSGETIEANRVIVETVRHAFGFRLIKPDETVAEGRLADELE